MTNSNQIRRYGSINSQTIIKCICIGANALTGCGVFTFPIIAPSLADRLHLSQPQLSTIVVAGLIGQYPFAALGGKLFDKVGSWACSLCAMSMFAIGYGLFGWTVHKHVSEDYPVSPAAFRLMVGCFFLLGLGSMFSYFSSTFAAAKEFPRQTGLATGIALALFGLSPLFLSLPSSWFIAGKDYVEAQSYIIFLGLVTGIVHLLSSIGFYYSIRSGQSRNEPTSEIHAEQPSETSPDEETPLIPKTSTPAEEQSFLTLLADKHFWWLWVSVALVTGSAEMIIGNVATIVVSLPKAESPKLTVIPNIVSSQVQIISISNTLSRLIAGPLIDIFCPSPFATDARRPWPGRVGIIASAAMLLGTAYAYMATLVKFQSQVWLLSAATGIGYGMIWTVIPGLVKLVWGEANLGRNAGMISYAPFFSTPVWSYIFANNVQRANGPISGGHEHNCEGAACWGATFEMASVTVFIVGLGLLPLWKKWKGWV
ncbi:putative monocarboxylate transporter mch1 [Tulasnella sp. 419]|nr:putative monocarboxylate transporter mch1 [Tulasnella sp. 419]